MKSRNLVLTLEIIFILLVCAVIYSFRNVASADISYHTDQVVLSDAEE